MKAMTSLRVPQGGNGDHIKIYIWQGPLVSGEYRQKTIFALATGQNSHQIKSCHSRAIGQSPQLNLKSKISPATFSSPTGFGLAALFLQRLTLRPTFSQQLFSPCLFYSVFFRCVHPTGQIFSSNLLNHLHASRTVIQTGNIAKCLAAMFQKFFMQFDIQLV